MVEYDYEGVRELEFFKDKDLRYAFDSLTKVFDRETITDYIRWLTEHNKPFSLFIVDIDNFKNVNDIYGHQVGDIALTETAAYLLSHVIKKGVIGRYGGDEFFIVFENVVEYEDVWNYGHDIDLGISAINIEGFPRLSLTVSIGISRFPLDAKDYDNIVLLADKALYRAKSKGRNCFIIYLAAKHANIVMSKITEKSFTSMEMCNAVFNNITAYGEDISTGIRTLFRHCVNQYMFDHICLESPGKINFNFVHKLAEIKTFEHIPIELIDSLVNTSGYISINNTKNLKESFSEDYINICREQGLTATLYCRVSAYGNNYGYIRVDSVQTARIWQNNEITNLITAANVIGLLLYYQKKTLDGLPDEPTVITAESET